LEIQLATPIPEIKILQPISLLNCGIKACYKFSLSMVDETMIDYFALFHEMDPLAKRYT